MKLLILSAGLPPSKKMLLNEIAKHDTFFCVDGGANFLWKHKIIPNYLIGDLDSINKEALKYFSKKNVTIEKHPPNKDSTDTEIALKKAIKLGAKKITFLGCTGGKRTDHLIGAFGLLLKCLNLQIESSFKDKYQTIFLINKSLDINSYPGTKFSIQAYNETVKGLTITGAKYPLKNYTLEIGDALTIANEFKNKTVNLSLYSGTALIFLETPN